MDDEPALLLQEVAGAFEPTYRDVLLRHLNFHDLSPSYFAESVVPSSWSSLASPLLTSSPARPRDQASGP